jgi:hypothetical protein
MGYETFIYAVINDIKKLNENKNIKIKEVTSFKGSPDKSKEVMRKIKSEEDFVKLQVPWIL